MLSPKDIEYYEQFRSKFDNKFHYVYKIVNILNNCYYYGVHNTSSINDEYMGSGNLIKRAIKSVGKENFAKEFINFFETSDEAFDCESKIVDENMIKNPNCYNLALGGRDGVGKTGKINKHTKGRIHVNNGVVEKMIYPHDKQEYLNEGWVMGCICRPQRRKIYVNKNGQDLRIWRDELQDYLNAGWNRSSISNTGKIHINNGIEHKMINPEDLQRYLDDGWKRGKLGKTTKNMIWIKKDGVAHQINLEDLQQYLDDGWKRGNLNQHLKNKICINNGIENKFINPKDLQQYLDGGWERGVYKRKNDIKQIWINKDGETKKIFKTDLLIFLNDGWKRGTNYKTNGGRICVVNRQLNKQKFINPKDLQQYLDGGWERGNLRKIFKDERVYVFKFIDGKKIYKPIKNTLLQQYLDDGWLATRQHKKSS